MTPVDNRVKRVVIRRLNSSPRQSSSKTGNHTGRNTTWGGNYREVSLMTHHQSEPRPSYKNRIIYGQKFPVDGNQGQNFANHAPRSQGAATSGNSQLAPSVIIPNSSQSGAAGPFYQSLHPPPAADRRDAQRSHSEETFLWSNGAQTFWQPAGSVLFSTQSSGQSPAALRARHGSLREKNKLDVVGPWRTRSKTETNKFFSSASKTSTPRPLVSNSLQPSKFKSILSPDKQESSSIDSTQRSSGVYSKKSPLFSTSLGPVSERVAAASEHRLPEPDIHSQMSSEGEEVQRGVPDPRRSKPGKSHHGKSRFRHANVAKRREPVDSLTRYSRHSKVPSHSSGILPPKESVASGWVNLATEEVAQKTTDIAAFKGFVRRVRKPVNRFLNLSSGYTGEKNTFRKSILEKETFHVTNVYRPSLSPHHSFGVETTTPPNDVTPFPATSDGEVDEMTSSVSDYGAKIKRNRGRPFQSYSRSSGLKGFASWPHEGARDFNKRPYKSVRDQAAWWGLRGERFKIWQPERSRIDRWQNETAPGRGMVREDQKKEGNRSFAHLVLPSDHHKSVNVSDTRGEQNKTTAPVEHTHYPPSSSLPSSSSSSSLPSSSSSSFSPRPAEELRPNPLPPSLPRTVVGYYKPRPTVAVARGQRWRGQATMKPNNYSLPQNVVIIRKPGSRLPVFTYTDILGSASFTAMRVTNQTTVKPNPEDSSVPTAAEERMKKEEEEMDEEKGRGKEKEVEEVGEQKKEDMEEQEEGKEVKVEKVEPEGEENKGEKEVEDEENENIEGKGAKEVEAAERSVDSEVAIHSGNDTSRSPEANSGGDADPRGVDSAASMSELDCEGSGGGCWNTSDAYLTSEPQQGVSGSAVPESDHQEQAASVQEAVPHKT